MSWIGGFRIHPTHTDKSAFAWTDGSKFNYAAGDSGNLNNLYGNEFCLLLNKWQSFKWSTFNCEEKSFKGFICQTNTLENT